MFDKMNTGEYLSFHPSNQYKLARSAVFGETHGAYAA